MNQVTVHTGRALAAAHGAGRSDGALDALVSDGFASVRGLRPGDELTALVNGKRRVLRIVGTALSPEYIFAGMAGMPDMRGFGVFWVDHEALAAAYDMQGRVQPRRRQAGAPGLRARRARCPRACWHPTGARRAWPGRPGIARHAGQRDQGAARDGHRAARHFSGGGGLCCMWCSRAWCPRSANRLLRSRPWAMPTGPSPRTT